MHMCNLLTPIFSHKSWKYLILRVPSENIVNIFLNHDDFRGWAQNVWPLYSSTIGNGISRGKIAPWRMHRPLDFNFTPTLSKPTRIAGIFNRIPQGISTWFVWFFLDLQHCRHCSNMFKLYGMYWNVICYYINNAPFYTCIIYNNIPLPQCVKQATCKAGNVFKSTLNSFFSK